MSRSTKMSSNSPESDCGQMDLFPTGSLPAGPARATAQRARDLAWTIHALDYGRTSPVSLARYDPEDCCWRTRSVSLLSMKALTLAESSETWPRSGTMRSGIAYRLPPLTHPTSVIASGSSQLWPTLHGASPDGKTNGPRWNELGRAVNQSLVTTPMARSWKDRGCTAEYRRKSPSLASLVMRGLLPTPTASRRSGLQSHGKNAILGSLNPDWLEWLQGLPTRWTASTPSET